MNLSTPRVTGLRIESPSLAELVAEKVGELIFGGEIRPNDRLIEEHLCQRLGVSRAPVREGLRILEGSGLLVRRARAGVSVAPFTQDDVFEILTFREGLERMAIHHLYRYTKHVQRVDTSRLDAAYERLADAFGSDEDDFGRIHTSHDFHTELVRLCGNTRIVASYAQMTMQVKLCMSMNLRKLRPVESPADNIGRHWELRRAVLSGDPDEALRAIGAHGHDAFLREFLDDVTADDNLYDR